MIIDDVGPKDLGTPAHFEWLAQGPSRGGKRSRMTKEGPKLLGEIAEEHHVLSELVPREERAVRHPPQPSPSSPNKGTSVGGQL